MAAAHAAGAARLLSPLCASALMVASLVGHPIRIDAQSVSTSPAPSARASSSPGAEAEASALNLLVGRSAVIDIGTPIARVSLTSPDIADALVTTNQQLLVHGKAPGTISMFVWNRAGGIKRYEVIVQRDLSQLNEQLKQLFPGESIDVDSNGRDVVISGTVSSKYVMEKAADVAAGYVEKKENVVNLLRQAEGIASNQVLLRVRFAEVSRNAMTDLGAALFTGANGYKDYVGRTTTQQFAAPFFDEENGRPKLVFSDYLNLFIFNNKEGLGAVVKALQNKGLFQSLAEPNLIAENGKEASFLAGGEFPYPVAQGQQGNLSVTIVFKEFGIRLRFTPTVLGGDLINLKVAPEVSSLDFSNAVVTNGFRVPSLSTRRAETEVELRDGQTFAIAGLMNSTMTSTMQKIPGIGDIPILGLLFKSKSAQKDQTELVVMITPQIVRAGSMGAAPALPNLIEPFLGPSKKQLPPPPPWLGPTPPGGSAYAEPIAPPAQTPMPTNLRPRLAAAEPVPPEPIAKTSQPAAKPVAAAIPPAPVPAKKATKAPEAAASTPVRPPALMPREEVPRKRLESTEVAVEPAATPSASPSSVRKPTKDERQAAERAQETAERAQEALKRQEKADREAVARDAEARLKQEKIDARKRKEEAERAAEQAKADQERAAEDAKYEAERAADAREQAKKAAAEQARADAEAAKQQAALNKQHAALSKKQAEENKKMAEAQRKHEKVLAEAEARLRAAQAQYQAEVERSKKDKVAVAPQPQQP